MLDACLDAAADRGPNLICAVTPKSVALRSAFKQAFSNVTLDPAFSDHLAVTAGAPEQQPVPLTDLRTLNLLEDVGGAEFEIAGWLHSTMGWRPVHAAFYGVQI